MDRGANRAGRGLCPGRSDRPAIDTPPMLLAIVTDAADEVRAVLSARTMTHRYLRDRLVLIALATVGVDAVCAIVAWLLERHAPKTQVADIGTALFWTSTQLLTVSSSLANPLTTGGRVLDVFMEIYAITVVAALAGAVATFFHRRSHERDEQRGAHGAP